MRTRHLFVSAVALPLAAVAVAAASTATAGSSTLSPVHRTSGVAPVVRAYAAGTTCAKQPDNDAGVGIVSQNFEDSFNIYDARGADDFVVRSTCSVSEVDVNGAYFNGAGPAASLHVTFYADDNGLPGARVGNENDLAYTDTDGLGSFDIPLTTPVTFGPGTYWVSVKANLDFSTGGEWGWDTNLTARGRNAVWKNGGDGFATGCRQFADMRSCLGDQGQGPDFTFTLVK